MYLAYRKPPSQSIKGRESNGERPASTQPFIKALRVYKSFADLWQDVQERPPEELPAIGRLISLIQILRFRVNLIEMIWSR